MFAPNFATLQVGFADRLPGRRLRLRQVGSRRKTAANHAYADSEEQLQDLA